MRQVVCGEGTGEVAAPFHSIPINSLLGFELRASNPSGATVAFGPKPEHLQEYGVVHGGILGTAADTAAVYALHPFLDPAQRMTSVEFKLNFLAPANVRDGAIVATSTVVRQGRTIGVAEVTVTRGSNLLAKGLFTYVFLRAS